MNNFYLVTLNIFLCVILTSSFQFNHLNKVVTRKFHNIHKYIFSTPVPETPNANSSYLIQTDAILSYFNTVLRGYNSIFTSTSNITTMSRIGSATASVTGLVGSTIRKGFFPPTVRIIKSNIAIIGGGIAGLSCANELLRYGITDFVIIESSNRIGGRVTSDEFEGYILDRGFQVFIESYPESKLALNYDDLNLKSFLPGAIVRYKEGFHLVSDPIRQPQDIIQSLISPIGSLIDKIKVFFHEILLSFFFI